MERVKVCDVCGHRNEARERFCKGDASGQRCGVSLAGVPLTTFAEGEPVTQGPSQTGSAGAEGTSSEPPVTPTRRDTARKRASLLFPWGPEEIRDRLGVGREESFSPLWLHLRDHASVSRVHAELVFDGERLTVTHLGRTNPTYVQGRPLGTGQSLAIVDGDELAFSTQLRARVRID